MLCCPHFTVSDLIIELHISDLIIELLSLFIFYFYYLYICIYLSHIIFYFFLSGVKFPEKPPVLILRSVYHSSKGKPKFKVLASCPYHNFEGYVEQQVEIFKNECRGAAPNNQLVTLEN